VHKSAMGKEAETNTESAALPLRGVAPSPSRLCTVVNRARRSLPGLGTGGRRGFSLKWHHFGIISRQGGTKLMDRAKSFSHVHLRERPIRIWGVGQVAGRAVAIRGDMVLQGVALETQGVASGTQGVALGCFVTAPFGARRRTAQHQNFAVGLVWSPGRVRNVLPKQPSD
jgi:hypothetical protein